MKQKQPYDTHCKQCQFKTADTVYVKGFSGKEGFLLGIITKIQGPVTYTYDWTGRWKNGTPTCSYLDHLKLRVSLVEQVDKQNDDV